MAPQYLREPPTRSHAGAGTGGLGSGQGTPDPIDLLAERVSSFSRSMSSLVEVQKERSELDQRREQHLSVWKAAGYFAFAVAVACSVLFVMRGAVLGLTELFGGRVWLASLTAGLIVLATFVVGFLAATLVLAKRRERVASERRQQPPARRNRRVAVTRRTLF